MSIDGAIRPGVGIGPIRFGMQRNEVRTLLGPPDDIERTMYQDDSADEDWKYESELLCLTFSTDDEWRLGSIDCRSTETTLAGQRLVGRTAAAIETLDPPDLGTPTRGTDNAWFTYYEWAAAAVTARVDHDDGLVASVWFIPFYDESGETPLWPGSDAS